MTPERSRLRAVIPPPARPHRHPDQAGPAPNITVPITAGGGNPWNGSAGGASSWPKYPGGVASATGAEPPSSPEPVGPLFGGQRRDKRLVPKARNKLQTPGQEVAVTPQAVPDARDHGPEGRAPVQIAYLVNTYPRASHSFIRREIAALERLGVTVHRFAMRSDRPHLADPADLAEDDRTEHVLKTGKAGLIRGALAALAANPVAAAEALAVVQACGRAGRGRGVEGTGGRRRHLIYLAEAAHVAARCAALGVTHLHAHFGTNSATVAMLAHVLGGPRWSMTVHGPEEFDAPVALALREKIGRAAFTVAVSSYGRSQLCRWARVTDWPRLHVVHCGIEPARFARTAPVPEGGPHLVAVGRLAEQKGFPVLIAALAQVAGDLPGARLVLVGDGPVRAGLEAQAQAAGIAGRVTFAGWQDEAGVRAALAGAQALALPSFAEGLPVVAMEAMAAGRPVIGTLIAGIPELVIPGETGWLVPAGDVAALAGAIRGLAATPPERLAAMGDAARARALARHDVGVSAARLKALFAG